jgi:FMNH2-dependent dimethyl sulfone monooxygenase
MQLAATSEVGLVGVALAFVNDKDELPCFIETVLPLLREAGLRG